MSDDTFADTFRSLRKHSEYYLSGGDLYILVEDVKFRVHRFFFERESWYFRKKLNGSEGPKGTSDSTAIVLDDVAADDFARFLWVFYNPKYSLYDTTFEDWAAILDLAHHWDFTEVKKLVIRELEKFDLPDVDKIALYHEYNIDRSLLVSCYIGLCEREQPLTHEEGECLGLETVLTIFRAREHARGTVSADGQRQAVPSNMARGELEELMKSAFRVGQIIENGYLNSPGGSEVASLHQVDLADSVSNWSQNQVISPRTPVLPSPTVEVPMVDPLILVQTELPPIEELSGKGPNEDESEKSDEEEDEWGETSLSDISDNTKVDSIINLNAAETEKPPLDPTTNESATTAAETSNLVFVSESLDPITQMGDEINITEEVASPQSAPSNTDAGPETAPHTSIAEIQFTGVIGESCSAQTGTGGTGEEKQEAGSTTDLQQSPSASESTSESTSVVDDKSGNNADGDAQVESTEDSKQEVGSTTDLQQSSSASESTSLVDGKSGNNADGDAQVESAKDSSSQDEAKVEGEDGQVSASVRISPAGGDGTMATNADAVQEQPAKDSGTVSDEVKEGETDSFVSALSDNKPADNGESDGTAADQSANEISPLGDEGQSSSSVPDPDLVDNSAPYPQPATEIEASSSESETSASSPLIPNPLDIPDLTTQAGAGELSLNVSDPAQSTSTSESVFPANPNPLDNSNADIPDSTTQAEAGELSVNVTAPAQSTSESDPAFPANDIPDATTGAGDGEPSLISVSDPVPAANGNREANLANAESKNEETSASEDKAAAVSPVESKEGEIEMHASTSENPVDKPEAVAQDQPATETFSSEGVSASAPPAETQADTNAQDSSAQNIGAWKLEDEVSLISPSVSFSSSDSNQMNSLKTEAEAAENASESGEHVELFSAEAGVLSAASAVSPGETDPSDAPLPDNVQPGESKREGCKLVIPGDEDEDDNQTFYDSPQYPPEQDSLAGLIF